MGFPAAGFSLSMMQTASKGEGILPLYDIVASGMQATQKLLVHGPNSGTVQKAPSRENVQTASFGFSAFTDCLRAQ
eukprot:1139500-Amphidinium_carterae.1